MNKNSKILTMNYKILKLILGKFQKENPKSMKHKLKRMRNLESSLGIWS